MVYGAIDNDDDPTDWKLEETTSGVEYLDASDEGTSDNEEAVFREPDSYDSRMEKVVEYGHLGAQELRTTFPESQPFLRTRKLSKDSDTRVEASR